MKAFLSKFVRDFISSQFDGTDKLIRQRKTATIEKLEDRIVLDAAFFVEENMLLNGSFEQAIETAGEYGSLDGWDGVNGNIKVVNESRHGNFAIELDSSDQIRDRIVQTINVDEAEEYLLTFELRGGNGDSFKTNDVSIIWNGQKIDYRRGTQNWQTVSIVLSGHGTGPVNLEFEEFWNQDKPAGDGAGPLLDDIRVYKIAKTRELVNGTFDSLKAPGKALHNSSEVVGWKSRNDDQSDGRIRIRSGNPTAERSGKYLVVDSGAGRLDRIIKNVTTDPNQNYVLSFDIRSRSELDTISNQLRVRWNGAYVSTVYGGKQWQTVSVFLPASGSQKTKLVFREPGEIGASDGVGPLVDNVRLYGIDQTGGPIIDQIANTTIAAGSRLEIPISVKNSKPNELLDFSVDSEFLTESDSVFLQQTGNDTAIIRWTPDFEWVEQQLKFQVSVGVNGQSGTSDIEEFFINVEAATDTSVLTEKGVFSQTVSQLVEVGQVAGTRKITFDLDSVFDKTDKLSKSHDVFQVYLLDPDDETSTLLDGGKEGTPVFSLSESQTEFLPGIVQYNGNRVEIDVSSVEGISTGKLRFQLINSDLDGNTKIGVGNVSSVVDPDGLSSPSIETYVAPMDAGSSVDLDQYSVIEEADFTISQVRFDETTGDYHASITVENTGSDLGRNLVIVFADLNSEVALTNASGQFPNGDRYINIRDAITSGGLVHGESSDPVLISASNPEFARLGLKPVLYSGLPNRTPKLDVIEPITILPGRVLRIDLGGVDPDGDEIAYSVDSNRNLPSSEIDASGIFTIRPVATDVGYYSFDIVASDGRLKTSQSVELTVVEDENVSTRISGFVLDVDEIPLTGLVVELGDESAVVDSDGRFVINLDESPSPTSELRFRGDLYGAKGDFPFVVEKLFLLTSRPIESGSFNEIERPIYLPLLNEGTQIQPNVDNIISQVLLPNFEPASVFVQANSLLKSDGTVFDGNLSITFVPADRTPAELPSIIPGMVVTIQPGEMTFQQPAQLTLPNIYGDAAGTEMDLWSVDPMTGDFAIVGVGRVSADEQLINTVSGGIRNSSWHFFSLAKSPFDRFDPIKSETENLAEGCPSCRATTPFNSDVELHTGALIETHDLASYSSLGQRQGLILRYDSTRARPQRILVARGAYWGRPSFIVVRMQLTTILQVRSSNVSLTLHQEKRSLGSEPYVVNEFAQKLEGDLSDFPTGLLEYSLSRQTEGLPGHAPGLRGYRGVLGPSGGDIGEFLHVNTSNSSLGAGWEIAGLQTLVESGSGDVMLWDGAGQDMVFRATEIEGNYQSPSGEFSTLVKNRDGTYTRTTLDKTTYSFDFQGRLVEVVDRVGNKTAYDYGADGLSSIVDPVGLKTNLNYAGGLLKEVIDPSGRTTSFAHDSHGNLLRISDPDGTSRTFEYDSDHRMIGEVDKRGNLERTTYSSDGLVESTDRKDGSKIEVRPLQAREIGNDSENTRAKVVDGRGAVSEFDLDQSGQIKSASDQFGTFQQVERDELNQVTTTVDGNGNRIEYDYDDRGNVIRETYSLGISPSSEFVANDPFSNTIGGFRNLKSVLGDFDGDGRNDLAVAGSTMIEIYSIDETGEFSSVQTLFGQLFGNLGAEYSDLKTGDVTGDGLLDLVVSDDRNGLVWIFNGNEDGSFDDNATFWAIAKKGAKPIAIELGDFDGDSHLDVIAINDVGNDLGNGESVSVIYGDGEGVFSAPTSFDVITSGPFGEEESAPPFVVAVSDVNNDGKDDALLLVYGEFEFDTHAALLISQSKGLFEQTGVVFLSNQLWDVTVADTNRDGISEFIGVGSNVVSISPQLEETTIAFDVFSNFLQVADVNGDQIADLVSSSNAGFKIAEGIGDGSFANMENFNFGIPTNSSTLLINDFDGNGTNDIISVGEDLNVFNKFWLFSANLTAIETFASRTYEYDPAFNQLMSYTDELGKKTLFEIDPLNGNPLSERRVVGAIDGDGNLENDDLVTRFTYSTNGLLASETDPIGRTTQYSYNPRGQLTSVLFASGLSDEAVQRFEYDLAGNRTASIDENGNRTEFEYDLMNRIKLIRESDPDANGPLLSPVSEFVYDENGNLSLTIDSNGNRTINMYDALDRLSLSIDSEGGKTRFGYDFDGNLQSIVDPLGFVTRNHYDSRNRLLHSVDPEGGITRFSYDANDNLAFLTDPGGNRTIFKYDPKNRLIAEIDPLGESAEYIYDAADNIVQTTDRNGRITEFEYDDLDRLIAEIWIGKDGEATENTIDYSYDKAGNLLEVSDYFSQLAFEYDSRDRIASVNNVGTPDAPNVVLDYTYDGVGNVVSVMDEIDGELGATTSYEYDGLNRAVTIQQSGNGLSDKLVDFKYNELGQFDEIARYSDLDRVNLVAKSDYEYDSLNRLVDLDHLNSANDVLAFYDFDYDSSSRITKITDVDGVTNYSYDDRSQLTAADRNANDLRGDESYSYDENGNRVESHLHGDEYETGVGNRLISDGVFKYEYDAEGNTTKQTELASGDYREFVWDNRNRLVRVTDFSAIGNITQDVSFAYDSLNRRIAKSVDADGEGSEPEKSTLFVYDREDVILDFIGNTDAMSKLIFDQRYLHGPQIDQVLAQENADTKWHLTDHLGTTRELVDSLSDVPNHYSFDSFGNVISNLSVNIETRYLFTGREFDIETNMYYYRARFYSASLSRFISEDPIGLNGDSNNRYRYVQNKPILNTDPSGLMSRSTFSKHIDRNLLNRCPKEAPLQGCSTESEGFVDNEGSIWIEDVTGGILYHGSNQTFRGTGRNRGSQCVYDDNGLLITTGRHQGTYDYFPPFNDDGSVIFKNVIPHRIFDIDPHNQYPDIPYTLIPDENIF